MPARTWKFRIEDILEAIEDISRLTSGMTYESFCADNRTAKAVLYNMAVIGLFRKMSTRVAERM